MPPLILWGAERSGYRRSKTPRASRRSIRRRIESLPIRRFSALDDNWSASSKLQQKPPSRPAINNAAVTVEREYGFEDASAEGHRRQFDNRSCVTVARRDKAHADDLPALVDGVPGHAAVNLVAELVHAAE